MLQQKRKMGAMSRLKGMLHRKHDNTARPEDVADEFTPKLQVLPPTPPPSPPRGALIAGQNWPEFGFHPRHTQRTYNPSAGPREETRSRGAETTAGDELEPCAVGHYAPTETETSCGSVLSSTRMRMGSASTEATSRGSTAEEEEVIPAKGIAADQYGCGEAITCDDVEYHRRDSLVAPDEKCFNGESLAGQTGDSGIQ